MSIKNLLRSRSQDKMHSVLAQILISTDPGVRIERIQKVLDTNNLKKDHPDVFYLEAGEKMGVKEARVIINHLSTKPYQAKAKAVLIEDASNLSPDAQNTLLKTLEEPPEEAILVLGVNSENDLLPTILSRCELVYAATPEVATYKPNVIASPERAKQSSQELQFEKDIEKLINSTIPERFAYIEKLKEKEEFLKALIKYFHQQLRSHIGSGNSKFLNELLEAEKWMNSNVNQRAILEYLMLNLPLD